MTVLKTFCRYGSLRTGTIVAGFAGIILAILGIILIFTITVDFRTIVMDWLPSWIVRIIMAINFSMTILISLLLILGVVKRNMFLMLPWVILGILLAVGILVCVIYNSIVWFIQGNNFNGAMCLVIGLIGLVIYVYMWLVVYSFFTIIKEEYDRGAYIKDPFRRK